MQLKYDDQSIHLQLKAVFFSILVLLSWQTEHLGLVDLRAPSKPRACPSDGSLDRVSERATSRACGYGTPTSIFYHMLI